MTIVEKLGGKPGQQTISDLVSNVSSIPFIADMDKFEMEHAVNFDPSEEITARYISIDGTVVQKPCVELDEVGFNTFSNPFLTPNGVPDNYVSYVSDIRKTRNDALNPEDYYPDGPEVVASATDVIVFGPNIDDEKTIIMFREGTLKIEKGTKKG